MLQVNMREACLAGFSLGCEQAQLKTSASGIKLLHFELDSGDMFLKMRCFCYPESNVV